MDWPEIAFPLLVVAIVATGVWALRAAAMDDTGGGSTFVNVTASGTVAAADLSASDDLTVADDAAITGDLDLDGSLILPGTNNTLTGSGSTISTGNSLMVNNNFSVGGTITASGLVRAGSATFLLRGEPADGASAVAVSLVSLNTLTNASARLLTVTNNATVKLGVGPEGKLDMNCGDSTGTPGNATLNTPCGRSAIAAAASTITITSSQVTATDVCRAMLQETDATCLFVFRCIPAAGSLQIILDGACTAATDVGWEVIQ